MNFRHDVRICVQARHNTAVAFPTEELHNGTRSYVHTHAARAHSNSAAPTPRPVTLEHTYTHNTQIPLLKRMHKHARNQSKIVIQNPLWFNAPPPWPRTHVQEMDRKCRKQTFLHETLMSVFRK